MIEWSIRDGQVFYIAMLRMHAPTPCKAECERKIVAEGCGIVATGVHRGWDCWKVVSKTKREISELGYMLNRHLNEKVPLLVANSEAQLEFGIIGYSAREGKE